LPPSIRIAGATSRSGVVVTPQPKGVPVPEMRLDHISFLVADLDAAIDKWKKILGILDPKQAEGITYGEGVEGGEHMKWATFVNPGGCAIQLFEPAPGGFLKKILDKRGEHVHHVAFLSSDVDATVDELRAADIPLVQEENTAPDTLPWLKWNFVPPDYVGGVLIEVAQRYNVEGNEWVPVPGDPS
jgi:methylmalonyl-CoA/ethylmalonyl-CoA epimerase